MATNTVSKDPANAVGVQKPEISSHGPALIPAGKCLLFRYLSSDINVANKCLMYARSV